MVFEYDFNGKRCKQRIASPQCKDAPLSLQLQQKLLWKRLGRRCCSRSGEIAQDNFENIPLRHAQETMPDATTIQASNFSSFMDWHVENCMAKRPTWNDQPIYCHWAKSSKLPQRHRHRSTPIRYWPREKSIRMNMNRTVWWIVVLGRRICNIYILVHIHALCYMVHTVSTCLFPGNIVMVMSACSNKKQRCDMVSRME